MILPTFFFVFFETFVLSSNIYQQMNIRAQTLSLLFSVLLIHWNACLTISLHQANSTISVLKNSHHTSKLFEELFSAEHYLQYGFLLSHPFPLQGRIKHSKLRATFFNELILFYIILLINFAFTSNLKSLQPTEVHMTSLLKMLILLSAYLPILTQFTNNFFFFFMVF